MELEEKINELLDSIKCTSVYYGKSTETAGNVYRVFLTRNHKHAWMYFHDNKYNESTLKDFLYSLVLDAQAYYNAGSFALFCQEFGYNLDSIKSYKIYEACKKQYLRLHRLFTIDEIELLEEFYQEY